MKHWQSQEPHHASACAWGEGGLTQLQTFNSLITSSKIRLYSITMLPFPPYPPPMDKSTYKATILKYHDLAVSNHRQVQYLGLRRVLNTPMEVCPV